MDFNALLLQIQELEQVNRQEEQKFLQEKGLHNHTKQELQQGIDLILLNWNSSMPITKQHIAREKIAELTAKHVATLEELARLQSNEGTNSKIIKQLKSTLKETKAEIAVLHEHAEKEKQLMQNKR